MSNDVVEESYNTGLVSGNQNYNSPSALQMRLDTSYLIENVEMFLRGNKLVVSKDENGEMSQQLVSFGIAKANEAGIQGILSYLQSVLNTAVVQGYLPEKNGVSEQYDHMIYEITEELSVMLMYNLYYWEVSEHEYDLIINTIKNYAYFFLSRTVGDRERQSYEQTVKHTESNTIKEGGQKFSLFNRVDK